MKLLQIGAPKSGNYWLYKIVRSTYDLAGCPQVFRKFDRIVYIVRDPRDVMISRAKFLFTPYMQGYYAHSYPDVATVLESELEQVVTGWLRHVGLYLQHRNEFNIHVIFYERMLDDLSGEIARFHEYMGLTPKPEHEEVIRQAVSFESMKAESPGHVRKGQAYGWPKSLTPAQQDRVATLAEPLLRLLNYPLSPEECASKLPSLPDDFQYDPPPPYQPPQPSRLQTFLRRAQYKTRRMLKLV